MAWTPQKEWLGQDAHIIGGGSSLLGFDFGQLRGKNTIGCNDAYRLGPDVVKICLFCDQSWWQKNKFDLEKFQGRVVCVSPALKYIRLNWMLYLERVQDGLHNGSTIGWNKSAGASSINVAINLGATRVFLLGFDLAQKQGKTHWHKHRKGPTPQASFVRFQRGFDSIAKDLPKFPGVSVVNVSDGTSKLAGFPVISFDEWREAKR